MYIYIHTFKKKTYVYILGFPKLRLPPSHPNFDHLSIESSLVLGAMTEAMLEHLAQKLPVSRLQRDLTEPWPWRIGGGV